MELDYQQEGNQFKSINRPIEPNLPNIGAKTDMENTPGSIRPRTPRKNARGKRPFRADQGREADDNESIQSTETNLQTPVPRMTGESSGQANQQQQQSDRMNEVMAQLLQRVDDMEQDRQQQLQHMQNMEQEHQQERQKLEALRRQQQKRSRTRRYENR